MLRCAHPTAPGIQYLHHGLYMYIVHQKIKSYAISHITVINEFMQGVRERISLVPGKVKCYFNSTYINSNLKVVT